MQVIMQIALLHGLPFIPVEPNAAATLAMIQGEVKTVPDQILDQAEATLGTIYGYARFSQMQAAILIISLRKIRAVDLEPLPIVRSSDPVPTADGALKRSEIRFQLS